MSIWIVYYNNRYTGSIAVLFSVTHKNWPKISIIYFTLIFFFFLNLLRNYISLVRNPGLPKIYFHAKFQEDSYKNEKDKVLKNTTKTKNTHENTSFFRENRTC